MTTMKAFSVKQPFAELILLGIKPVENRWLGLRYRGPALVHASKQVNWDCWEANKRVLMKHGRHIDDLERGGIVGVVDIVDCVRRHPSRYANNDDVSWAWVLENPRRLPFFPYPGQTTFFNVEDTGKLSGRARASDDVVPADRRKAKPAAKRPVARKVDGRGVDELRAMLLAQLGPGECVKTDVLLRGVGVQLGHARLTAKVKEPLLAAVRSALKRGELAAQGKTMVFRPLERGWSNPS